MLNPVLAWLSDNTTLRGLALLDEPFQGLAPALALRYSEAPDRLRAALPDMAILITGSSPALLRPLVDRTYVIERGEIAPA